MLLQQTWRPQALLLQARASYRQAGSRDILLKADLILSIIIPGRRRGSTHVGSSIYECMVRTRIPLHGTIHDYHHRWIRMCRSTREISDENSSTSDHNLRSAFCQVNAML